MPGPGVHIRQGDHYWNQTGGVVCAERPEGQQWLTILQPEKGFVSQSQYSSFKSGARVVRQSIFWLWEALGKVGGGVPPIGAAAATEAPVLFWDHFWVPLISKGIDTVPPQ